MTLSAGKWGEKREGYNQTRCWRHNRLESCLFLPKNPSPSCEYTSNNIKKFCVGIINSQSLFQLNFTWLKTFVAYMECRVKFSIFEIAPKDCSSHVWWLLWIHGRTESVEPPGIRKLFPKCWGNTKEDSRWSDQQHWITIAGGSNSITSDLRSGLRLHPPTPSQPASFIGLVGKERCRVPHYQNLESGSDTQGITSKQSKCGDWIILIFGPGERPEVYFICLSFHALSIIFLMGQNDW